MRPDSHGSDRNLSLSLDGLPLCENTSDVDTNIAHVSLVKLVVLKVYAFPTSTRDLSWHALHNPLVVNNDEGKTTSSRCPTTSPGVSTTTPPTTSLLNHPTAPNVALSCDRVTLIIGGNQVGAAVKRREEGNVWPSGKQ